jgi:hypothetical protein
LADALLIPSKVPARNVSYGLDDAVLFFIMKISYETLLTQMILYAIIQQMRRKRLIKYKMQSDKEIIIYGN